MSDVSIIGSGNMASAIGALALKGGNAVEIVGRDAAKAAALARALGDGATAGTWGAQRTPGRLDPSEPAPGSPIFPSRVPRRSQ